MKSDAYLRTFSEFFLDGAKIIFGSVVIGAFIPGAENQISWLAFFAGIVATAFFLGASAAITNLSATQKI